MASAQSYELFKLSTEEALVDALASNMAKALEGAIDARGYASLAVSGGTSPKPVFQKLSNAAINWAKVVITLVDDRWVSPQHNDSNEKLVRENLLVGEASSAQWLPLYNASESPYAGLQSCNELINSHPVLSKPLDVVLLGMGEDGHTASLFPCSAEVEQAVSTEYTAPCLAVTPTTAPHARISLSLNKIVSANQLFLLLKGESKMQVFENAVATLEAVSWKEMPIRAVIAEAGAKLSVFWTP